MKKHVPAARVRLEALEDRLTPASYISGGDLHIVGDNNANSVTVQQAVVDGKSYYVVGEGFGTSYYLASAVTGGTVRFSGYGGNDYFKNFTSLRTVAYGGDGMDTLVGGAGNDWLDGGNGSDVLYGEGGNDTLWAGFDGSTNTLRGGTGHDQLTGGYGTDYLYGDPGNDKLVGSLGVDYLWGGDGDDVLDGGDDGVHDVLTGGPGHDSFQREWVSAGIYAFNRDAPVDFDIWLDSYYDNPPPPA